MKLFNTTFDLKMEPVAYRGGFAALQGLAQGEVEVSAGIPSALRPLESTGRIRLLAAAQSSRLGRYPDVPTVAEAVGTPFKFSTWGGVVAPRAEARTMSSRSYDASSRTTSIGSGTCQRL
jgi:tripartite-type tricarboxylate transporter receptor subunit TctC